MKLQPRAAAAGAVATLIAVVGFAGPAAAAPTSGYGYVWGYQPAAPGYVAVSGYEHNSAGGPITITRSGPGDYRIRFAGLALRDALPHASAYGPGNSDFCTVAGWAPSGPDEVIRVRCFDGLGAPSDSMFVANLTNEHSPSLGYAYANIPNPAGWYKPALQFDATGTAVTVGRTAAGHYLVDLGTLAADVPGLHYDGHLRATAFGSAPVRCEVLDPSFWAPPVAPVNCYDVAGVAVDSAFTISYSRKVDLLGRAPTYGDAIVQPSPLGPPSILGWTDPAGVPTATEVAEGWYRVRLPGLATRGGHAMASAFGTPPAYCTVAGWWPSGTDEVVSVQCYDAALHAPTAVYAFSVTFTP